MYQTPTPIWNEIAASQPLQTPLWARLFKATDLPTALEPVVADLEAAGADARTIRAYLLVAPLLQENLAISRWIEETGRTSLRNSMPELETENEAMILASQEFSLKPSQQTVLRRLLRGDWTTPASASASVKPTPPR